MFGLFSACLSILSLTSALPAGNTTSLIERRYDGYSAPRSIIYIQTFRYVNETTLSLLPIYEQNTRATNVYLAAVHVNDPPGEIDLNDNPINSTYWDNIYSEAAQLQQDGVKVMMMLGGAARGSYARLCSGDGKGGIINETYYTPLVQTLRYHNIDGLDLDIEEQVSAYCPIALLQQLNADLGPQFILTMAPLASDMDSREYGLGGFNYPGVDAQATAPNKQQLVNWYNVQFYNGWGDASTPTGYNAIIENGWSPDRIVMGVLDNKGDGTSGWYNLSTYQNTISTLKANYPNFGGDVGWEYWDAGGSDGIDNPPDWVKGMSDATFGGTTAEKNLIAEPIPQGQAPWPLLTETLQGLNVSHIVAIKALNITSGNLDAALDWLGLGNLVGTLLPLD